MKSIYKITVVDRRVVEYYVEAADAESARELLEASDDADKEFGHKTIDGEWSIESTELCVGL